MDREPAQEKARDQQQQQKDKTETKTETETETKLEIGDVGDLASSHVVDLGQGGGQWQQWR